jgi:hypothetical protein
MASRSIHFEYSIGPDGATGGQVYPCRCGETHRGEYAVYDYGHHNCFHDKPLLRLDETGDVMCPECGKAWQVA